MFNPDPRVQAIEIVPGHACWVIDDALLQPQALVELACEYRPLFQPAEHNAFPGPELRMPDAFSARLDDFFARHLRARLGARRTLRMYSRLSMVTLAPGQLQPRQWICHRDRMSVPADQRVLAAVLYLFEDAQLGGTAFYVPRRGKQEIDQLVHDSGVLAADAFTARYGLRPGYLTASNDWFEKVCSIPPRWNRLICYDGALFHSSDIVAPERLQDDPRRGRLTLNGFFTCSRALAVR